MTVRLETATASDIPQIIALMREFAEYEKLLDSFETTEERLQTALFGDGRVAEALLAFDGERAVAYAIFFPYFATFRGQRGFFLEDIFITKDYRGRGLGETILRRIAKLAQSRGFERIDFQVLGWNTPAIDFYEKLGAVRDDEERHFKFTDDAFRDLAG
ncbi:MAG: GNAT family N-acetyltransferase [Acidobacteria bacterium]|nr:GNAT family N-acetyltransferase [Acidobacteriota bacterium]